MSQVVLAFAAVQDVAHAVPVQRYPAAQGVVTIAGHMAPPPGQLAAATADLVVTHAGARQEVAAGYFWHMPAPSHEPLFPQVVAGVIAQIAPSVAACGSAMPAGTGTHAPGTAPLQV